MAHETFTECLHSSRLAGTVFTSSHDCHPASAYSFSARSPPRGFLSCFCNNRVFERVLSALNPTPNLEDQGTTLNLVSILQPIRHGWPYQEPKTPGRLNSIRSKVSEEPKFNIKYIIPMTETWILLNFQILQTIKIEVLLLYPYDEA